MHMLSKGLVRAFSMIGKYLCRFRGNHFVDMLALVISALRQQLENMNFNMDQNGELRVLRLLKLIKPRCAFDVGANKGDWSRLMADIYPSCQIHAFEIVPSTFEELRNIAVRYPNIITNNLGLSDNSESITIRYSDLDSSTATACPIKGMKSHELFYTKTIQGEARKAIDYIMENGINIIDFLKVDVEGMDLKVLKGFEDKLKQVRIIQFEYGIFNISSHDLLSDFCDYLDTMGFVVGKIFPGYVDFFVYHFDKENFYGGNYLAVKRGEEEMIRRLSQRGA